MVTTIVVNETSLGYDDWWLPCGCLPADCIQAYAPKGAGNYAGSKVNLNNPGTLDGIDTGHAPDWDAVNGWKMNGSSQYIDTGVTDNPYPDGYTMIVKFSNFVLGVGESGAICGVSDNSQYFLIMSWDDSDVYGYGNNTDTVTRAYTQSGVRAVAGHKGYLNGNLDTNVAASNWSSSTPASILIGCQDFAGSGPSNHSEIYIQAFALYNKVLSQEQIQEIIGRMP